MFTHVGRLRKTDESPFPFDEAEDMLKMLYWFLSFVAGRRVGVVLPTGYDTSQQPAVARWDSRITQAADRLPGWYDEHFSADGLVEMFRTFRELWNDDYWQIIRRAIYTYTHAQEGIWGDVMMAQSALETLSWAVLVENGSQPMIADPQHRMTKSEFEDLIAADKVRKLLRWAGVPSGPPLAYDLLGPNAADLLHEQDPAGLDRPRAVTWMRNRITHPKPGGTTKLNRTGFSGVGGAPPLFRSRHI